ncbi:unnamed protein product [Protopolystoma xenopodis]|uniref:Uncharacterized protein n=1 Tax=Protopolystoma xenopodis TaxID=117903 RepID=A0A3S5ACS1_9PLAT|nr:unnamed protein product [Protopolystoma xenopodis]
MVQFGAAGSGWRSTVGDSIFRGGGEWYSGGRARTPHPKAINTTGLDTLQQGVKKMANCFWFVLWLDTECVLQAGDRNCELGRRASLLAKLKRQPLSIFLIVNR